MIRNPPYRAIALALLTCLLSLVPLSAQTTDPVKVSMSLDQRETTTRVVLTHSRSVVYTVQKFRGRIRVLYSEPIELSQQEQTVDGPHLERMRSRDDRTVTLFTGPEFESYEKFELRNPFRLIFDLDGANRSQARTRSQEQVVPRGLPRSARTVIVIDPGHGGIEKGAIGPTGLVEKDLTLDLANQLRATLQRSDPSIAVVLTRDEDRVVGLDERTAVANHNQADLFLSIHANSSTRRRAAGAETYYLSSSATDEDARRLAALENQGASSNGAPTRSVTGNSLDLVLWDLAQNRHLASSSSLAVSVQKYLNELTGIRNRGVRQAPFRILMGATMPAILVEVGFISNRSEEAKLKTADYRSQVVSALAAAVRDYLQTLERTSAPGVSRR